MTTLLGFPWWVTTTPSFCESSRHALRCVFASLTLTNFTGPPLGRRDHKCDYNLAMGAAFRVTIVEGAKADIKPRSVRGARAAQDERRAASPSGPRPNRIASHLACVRRAPAWRDAARRCTLRLYWCHSPVWKPW